MPRYYFDHNATTPLAGAALEAMLPCLRDAYGNASSIHQYGQEARMRVEQARRQVAALLNCRPKDIVFTSGGTEADNLAIRGAVRASAGSRKHLVTSTIEHPAVLQTCRALEKEDVDVTYIKVGSDGIVSPGDVRAALRPETVLISIMHANNELGTIQPVQEIAAIAAEANVPFHSDGVQAAGKLQVDLERLGIAFYSLSGHKFYGPKGAGALYVRKGASMDPIQHGGEHERGRRPGTENVAGIVGLGAAADLIPKELPAETARLQALRDRLEQGILARVPDTRVNGRKDARVANTSNISFDGVEGEAMVIALDLRGFAVSSGSACSSGAVRPSHVLTALGLSAERARSSLRFSLGKQNTAEQVDELIQAVAAAAEHLRRLSPARVSA